MPYPIKCVCFLFVFLFFIFLKPVRMVHILLMLKDSEVEDPFCGSFFDFEPSLIFGDYLFSVSFWALTLLG